MSGWNYVHVGPDSRTSLARHELYTEIGMALYERANTTWLLGGMDLDYHYPPGESLPHALNYWPPRSHGDLDPSNEPVARDPIDVIEKYRHYFDEELFNVYYAALACKEATPPAHYVRGLPAAGEVNLFDDAGLPAWMTLIGDIGEWKAGDVAEMEHSPTLWAGTILAINGQDVQVAFTNGNAAAARANWNYGVWNTTRFLDAGIVDASVLSDWTVAGAKLGEAGAGPWLAVRSLFTDFEAVCNCLTFFRNPDPWMPGSLVNDWYHADGDPTSRVGDSAPMNFDGVCYNAPAATRFVLCFRATFVGSGTGSLLVRMSGDYDPRETPSGASATWETLAAVPANDVGVAHWYKCETTNQDIWRPAPGCWACLRMDYSGGQSGDDMIFADGQAHFDFDWAYGA